MQKVVFITFLVLFVSAGRCCRTVDSSQIAIHLTECALQGTEALLEYHNPITQYFDGAGWWDSARAYTALVDRALFLDGEPSPILARNLRIMKANQYKKKQKEKKISTIEHHYASTSTAFLRSLESLNEKVSLHPKGKVETTFSQQVLSMLMLVLPIYAIEEEFSGSYDDIQWWAHMLAGGHDLAQKHGDTITADLFLDASEKVFLQLTPMWGTTCGGGIWWSSSHSYKNAITNELFVKLSGDLAKRFKAAGNAQKAQFYQDWAVRAFAWFNASAMINNDLLINDGLLNNQACTNNGGTTWTYNQGVICGGASNLFELTNNHAYLERAFALANAATTRLVDSNGILIEPCERPGNCDTDQTSFKGILQTNYWDVVRAVRVTQTVHFYNSTSYLVDFLVKNAESICRNNAAMTCPSSSPSIGAFNRRSSNTSSKLYFGLHWSGPFDTCSVERQTSGLSGVMSAIGALNLTQS